MMPSRVGRTVSNACRRQNMLELEVLVILALYVGYEITRRTRHGETT